MELSLKISCSDRVDLTILTDLRDGGYHLAKLSTTQIQLTPDRRDQRFIDSIKNIKIVLKKLDGGILILFGHLQCDHRPPYGGAFYVTKVVDSAVEYASVKGVSIRIRFATMDEPIIDNRDLQLLMGELVVSKDFEFNIGQFDEFMEIYSE